VEKFQPFSPLHAAALAAIAVATFAAVRGARRGPSPAVERAIGVAFVATWFAVHGWWLLPARFDATTTLPLQMCHWTALAAGLYLATQWRPLALILYFWGFGLCTQAMLTPALAEGPASHVFWYFWLSHGMIVGTAAYAIAAHGYRPTWRDWRLACVAAAVYAAAVIPVDLLVGANYGFLGPGKPDLPTIVDFLGPWPARLPAIFALVAGVMALLMLPWRFAAAK
jgi:hypothetical integral membrane protein (TIGR02206 family)